MSKNARAIVLVDFLADGCRVGALALSEIVVTPGSPNRVAFTAESVPGRKGARNDASLEELAFWRERFASGMRRAIMVTPVPERGLGPSEKMTFHIAYD